MYFQRPHCAEQVMIEGREVYFLVDDLDQDQALFSAYEHFSAAAFVRRVYLRLD
jgi:hypothetical protein